MFLRIYAKIQQIVPDEDYTKQNINDVKCMCDTYITTVYCWEKVILTHHKTAKLNNEELFYYNVSHC